MYSFWIKALLFFLCINLFNCTSSDSTEENSDTNYLEISVEGYKKAVYASWIGQIVGNTYGLCYEFKFVDEPGPDSFPYGYTWTLEELRKYDGAFSDDDTDIEYMYLTQMEEHGIEPNYYHLAEAWKKHVKKKVWCANRAALTLMHAGHYPPLTGSTDYNPQWCQIDPQLTNEIWAVTAPGMIDYATDKSAFCARITNDSFGIEPALHYAAMYSAAFFEKDINKLIDIGSEALHPDSKFHQIVENVKKIHTRYPNDWILARKIVKDEYLIYADYNRYAWPPIDANLNGAYGILALLYGNGDFQKTLDYCCAFGMDADNQAATMCGLLGIINGLESIPENLLYPLENVSWDKPFNDLYKMVTRADLPDARISDMAERIARQGEKLILAKGGRKIKRDSMDIYQINPNAKFHAPFELIPIPELYTELDTAFHYPIYTGVPNEELKIDLHGNLPPGIRVSKKSISGTSPQVGNYNFEIIAIHKNEEKRINVNLKVHSKNLAEFADEIVFNKKNALDHDIEIIRDGMVDKIYYSTKKGKSRELDYYGYKWNRAQRISAISYNNGVPHEFGGWFTSFNVEFLKNDQWVPVDDFRLYPEMNLDNSQWLKPSFINYEISFPQIETRGIRISGKAGGIQKDAANAHLGIQYYTAISELRVYRE